jgi:glycosyltransferase involved in cell wall biosynthesis
MILSVCIVTYNHERFIDECVRSVLAQETDFEFDIRIGEDRSSDATASVLHTLEAEFPHRITVKYRQQNLGAEKNFEDIVLSSDAKYVAFLEGDNCWIDPEKLQRQVDLLEAKPEVSFCFHRAQVVEQGAKDHAASGRTLPGDFTKRAQIDDFLIDSNPVPLGAMVVRRSLLDEMHDWLAGLKLGDWPMCIALANKGPVEFLDRTMSIQREHKGGSWSSLGSVQRELYTCQMLLRLLNFIGGHSQQRLSEMVSSKVDWIASVLCHDKNAKVVGLADLLHDIGDETLPGLLLENVLEKVVALNDANEWHQQNAESWKAAAEKCGRDYAALQEATKNG